MNNSKTTNDIRKIMEDAGACNVSRRAVEMIANPVDAIGDTQYWELRYLNDQIIKAVRAALGLKGEASYAAFQNALLGKKHSS